MRSPARSPARRAAAAPDTGEEEKRAATPAADSVREATKRGDERAVRELIDRPGADVEDRDADGCSALWWAAAQQRENCLKLLLGAGADVDARDARGGAPRARVRPGGATSVGEGNRRRRRRVGVGRR